MGFKSSSSFILPQKRSKSRKFSGTTWKLKLKNVRFEIFKLIKILVRTSCFQELTAKQTELLSALAEKSMK
jgi:hypothetical protein